jgi:hypothetical protein
VKAVVVALWIACIACFFLPESTITLLGQRLFWGLVIVHAIECIVFLPKLRRAGGSLGNHLVQTMIFGLFYARGLGDGVQPSAR